LLGPATRTAQQRALTRARPSNARPRGPLARVHSPSLALSLTRRSLLSSLYSLRLSSSRGLTTVARRPAGGHNHDDGAPVKLPRVSWPTTPTSPPRTYHLPANAMEGAPLDHGGTVAAAHGAPTTQAENSQNNKDGEHQWLTTIATEQSVDAER
jgi:hypothetical protein